MVWHRGRTRSGAPRGDADPEARASSSSSSSLRLAELLPARPDAETDSARLGDYRLVPDAPSPRGHPRDPRGRLVSPTSANAEGWRVDAPVRLRGRLARGRPDVVLELFRVESLPERPAGAPTRGSDWTRTSAGGGVGDPAARVVGVAETALVLACVDAADPRGLGGRAVFVAAAAGAARVAASAIRARRTRGDEARRRGKTKRDEARGTASASASASASARLAAVAARACEGALALYVSGAALRVVNPEWHATARRAAALAAVRVAFASPPRARAPRKNPPPPPPPPPPPTRARTPDGFAGRALGPVPPVPPVPPRSRAVWAPPRARPGAAPDFDARAWHARYRWAALRLMDLVPTRPAPPAARRVFAFLGASPSTWRRGGGRMRAPGTGGRTRRSRTRGSGTPGGGSRARREELRSAGTSARRGRRGSTSRGSRRAAAGPSGRGGAGRGDGAGAGGGGRGRRGASARAGTGRTSSSRAWTSTASRRETSSRRRRRSPRARRPRRRRRRRRKREFEDAPTRTRAQKPTRTMAQRPMRTTARRPTRTARWRTRGLPKAPTNPPLPGNPPALEGTSGATRVSPGGTPGTRRRWFARRTSRSRSPPSSSSPRLFCSSPSAGRSAAASAARERKRRTSFPPRRVRFFGAARFSSFTFASRSAARRS